MESKVRPTREAQRRWQLVATDPAGVVAAFSMDYSSAESPALGREIFQLCCAIEDIAVHDATLWKALVDAGITDSLCEAVYTLKLQHTDDYTLGEKTRAIINYTAPSPYFKPFFVLACASKHFSLPLSSTDLRYIASLKKHWSKMMKRIWDEPGNSITPTEEFVHERMSLPLLFSIIFGHDPSFLSVLDDETDMTIPVIVRSWVVSTDDRDAFVVSKAMFDLWTPDVPPLLPYRTANPAPASIFFRVIQGAGRDDIVVNTFASHLGTLRGVDANHELHFLLVLLTGSQRFEEPGERFLRLLVESKPLWTKLFSLIATSNTDDMSTEDICVVQYGLDVMTDTLKLCSSDTADLMTAELGRAWINAGVFDALDAITSHSLTHNLPRFSAQLLLIFVGLRCALDAAPELESILSGQLPRPRMLSTLQKLTETHLRVTDLFAPSFLLASDMKKLPRSLADLDAVSVGRAIRDCSQYMQALETRCVVAGQCGRRGCEARASSRCAKCRKIAYCGPKCQKKDWKAHKSVCSDQAR